MSSKAKVEVIKPDNRTAATRIKRDLTNIVKKGRLEKDYL